MRIRCFRIVKKFGFLVILLIGISLLCDVKIELKPLKYLNVRTDRISNLILNMKQNQSNNIQLVMEKGEASQSQNAMTVKDEFAIEKRSKHCMPIDTRLHTQCEKKFKYIKKAWIEKCFHVIHGVDGSDCSIIKYLREKEPFCAMKSTKHITGKIKTTAKLKRNLQGLLNILSSTEYHWMRKRISHLWPTWMEAIQDLYVTLKLKSRKQKNILFYMAGVVNLFGMAGKGGPVGEFVQWSDTIASAYILGHRISVFFNESHITNYFNGSKDSCAPNKSSQVADYDIIFTDYRGIRNLRVNLNEALLSHFYCKIRCLDSFGTEPEFNLQEYTGNIPGGKNIWGINNLHLQQYLTMFPHTPENTFLGFVAGNVIKNKLLKKKNQAVIYGKLGTYMKGHEKYIDIANEFFKVHSTFAYADKLPKYIINHGVLDSTSLTNLLTESKVFIGLGFPYEGPGPLDAIAAGMVYINPMFIPARNRLNEAFFGDKPTLRKVTSQNPYMEDFVKEPYVHTINVNNHTNLREIFQKIKSQNDLPSYLPREYTTTGMLERLNVLVENQNFCDESAKRWPPLSSRQIFLSKNGQSCKELCRERGLICEPSFFHELNNILTLEQYGYNCTKTVKGQLLYAPSFNTVSHTCHVQSHFLLYSCSAESNAHVRLCPCRDFIKDQTALCRDCL